MARFRLAISLTTVATVRRNMCGVTPSIPASPRTLRSWRRTFAVVNGVPSRLENTKASGE